MGYSVPETVIYFFVAANVRSIRSTLRTSARSSPANPPRAFSFSNSAFAGGLDELLELLLAGVLRFLSFGHRSPIPMG